MQIIDTFSGIGGFSLSGQWMGWRTIQFCEIDKFCQRILKYYWPNVPIHNDIKTLTSDIIKNNSLYDPNETTIFTGGVPCQPWSLAGKRKGTKDDRNLWPQTIKLIGEFKPDWAVLENVFGLTNWDGGLVFEQVQADLEDEGYEVQPYVLPACAVGAPHRRDRVWFIAHYNERNGKENGFQTGRQINVDRIKGVGASAHATITGRKKWEQNNRRTNKEEDRSGVDNRLERFGNIGITADPGNAGLQRSENRGGIREKRTKSHEQPPRFIRPNWDNFPTVAPLCSRNDGLSNRLSGITFSKWRNESIKAMGNAVVVPLVYQIFKAIEEYERTDP